MPSAPQHQPAAAHAETPGAPGPLEGGAEAPARSLGSIHIALIGLMGSGKTVVGRLIAEDLGWSLSDSDPVIDEAVGLSAREIKDGQGADALHQLEATHLLDALAAEPP